MNKSDDEEVTRGISPPLSDEERAILGRIGAIARMDARLHDLGALIDERAADLGERLIAYREGWLARLDDAPPPPEELRGARGPRDLVDWNQWGGYDLASGTTLENLTYRNGDWTGLHHPQAIPLDNAVVRNVELSFHRRWASRGYRLRANNLFERVTVSGVLQEHGFYWNLAGYGGNPALSTDVPSVTFRECLIERVGAQGIQLVSAVGRPTETPDPESDDTPGGPVVIERTTLRECGQNRGWGRASFALSVFRNRNAVVIKDVLVDNSGQSTSRGCLLVEGGGGAPVSVTGSTFLAGELEQPMAIIRDRQLVTLRGCRFEAAGGQDWIDFERCSNVQVTDCEGETRLRVDGVDAGTVGNPAQSLR